MCNYRQHKAQEIKMTQAGNSHAACMRENRKRKWLEEGNCNNVRKWTKLNAERTREYRETHNTSAEYMRNYKKCKAQENKTSHAVTSTDPTPIQITYNYSKANEYFQKNFYGNPFGYVCNTCDRIWYMNDLK
jgi:hypothetical protein